MESGDGVRRGVGRGRRVMGWEYGGGRERLYEGGNGLQRSLQGGFIAGRFIIGEVIKGASHHRGVITDQIPEPEHWGVYK